MNKFILLATLLTAGGLALISSPAQAAHPAAALRALHANAVEAGENAGIYQWARVNREVDRIVADAGGVEKALGAESAQALQKAVRELRAGRLNHDAARTREAARQVAELAELLLK